MKKIFVSLVVSMGFFASQATYAGKVNWFSNTKKISYGMIAVGTVAFLLGGKKLDDGLHSDNRPSGGNATLLAIIGFVGGMAVSGTGVVLSVGESVYEVLSAGEEVASFRAGEHRALVRVAKSGYGGKIVDDSSGQIYSSFYCGELCESLENRNKLISSSIIDIDNFAAQSAKEFENGAMSEEEIASGLVKILPSAFKNIQSLEVAKLIYTMAMVNQLQ